MRKRSILAMAAGLALALASQGAEAAEKLRIGFLPGVVDPFYQVMQLGVEKAAKDLGVDVVTQIPPTWGVEAQTIGGKGTVYINSTNPNVSSVEGRAKGFKEEMAKDYPAIKVEGPDFNLDDANKAAQQTAAVLTREPNLAGVFGTNVFSASGAGTAVVNAGLGGHVQVVAYDATKEAIELMDKGVVTLVLAQKPFDMGYMAVMFAAADAAGVTSLPRRVETGFAIIDKENVKDPAVARFIYRVPGK